MQVKATARGKKIEKKKHKCSCPSLGLCSLKTWKNMNINGPEMEVSLFFSPVKHNPIIGTKRSSPIPNFYECESVPGKFLTQDVEFKS